MDLVSKSYGYTMDLVSKSYGYTMDLVVQLQIS